MTRRRQTFHTYDVLRLEVEDDAAGLTNYVKNTNGELGGWFYITETIGQALATSTDPALPGFVWTATTGTVQGDSIAGNLYTEPTPVKAGEHVAARFKVNGAPANHSVGAGLLFTLTDGTQALGSIGFPAQPTPGGTYFVPHAVAPAGVVSVALVIVITRFDTAAIPPGPFYFTDVMLTHQVDPIPEVYPFVAMRWTNILATSHQLRIDREGLNVGTLNAQVADASLDPATAMALRPGKAIRLVVDQAGVEPLFTGTILNATSTYDYRRTKASQRVNIALVATDPATKLANVPRANGVARIAELATVLEGCGVPWRLDGDTGQARQAPAFAALNANAKALDQVQVTRDTNHAYAWVDRRGVIVVSTDGDRPAGGGVWATLDPSIYDDVELDFSTTECVNVVTVKLLRTNLATGDTVTVTYGPFSDQASVDVWGAYAAEFTVQGLEDTEAAAKAYADVVLAANAQPRVRINSARLTITELEHLTTQAGQLRALLDLYQHVTVLAGMDEPTDPFASYPPAYPNPGDYPEARVQESLVTGLTHTITPKRWTLDLRFTETTSVPLPQSTPAP